MKHTALLLLGLLAFASQCATAATSHPNFVVIFIDDMGYGDIEPFGSTINRTPELSRMAAEGMKLTSFYVASPVCTPSRAALMTGCYPKRLGLAYGSDHLVLFPGDPHGLHPDEVTIAEILQRQGYATGCFGKWHLGDQPGFLPTDQGFDRYYGIPYSNDMWPPHPNKKWDFPPLPLLEDEQVVGRVDTMEDQTQLCRWFTDAAVKFIYDHQNEPFFVYLPHAFVHHPRDARDTFKESARETTAQGSTPNNERIVTKAQIEEVDWSVGQILHTLRSLKLAEKTLVLFTSDNGGARGCVNTPLRGGKGSPFEGGMREPTLAWWPGTIPARSVTDEIVTSLDVLPTFSNLAGARLPRDRRIDGHNVAPILRAVTNAKTPTDKFYYYQRNQLKAVRSGPWKLFANGELYHLKRDIAEANDISEAHPAVVERLRLLLEEARRDLGDGEQPGEQVRPVGLVDQPRTLLPRDGVPGKAGFALRCG